jgi:hypothetical protein
MRQSCRPLLLAALTLGPALASAAPKAASD